MVTIRRLYIYLVSTISLASITFALIALLRNLIFFKVIHPQNITLALQIALLIVGLPFYLVHWFWAQRLARQEADERESGLRRLYIYIILAGLLSVALANLFDLFGSLAQLDSTLSRQPGYVVSFASGSPKVVASLNPLGGVLFQSIPLVVLGILMLYHWKVLASDIQKVPDTNGTNAVIRRWFMYGFAALGLNLILEGCIYGTQWLLFQFWKLPTKSNVIVTKDNLFTELIFLALGVGVWLFFWSAIQRRFRRDPDEQASSLRKFFLYLAVFTGTLGVAIYATITIESGIGFQLRLPREGDFRELLPIILWMGAVWVFFSYVLRQDMAVSTDAAEGRKDDIARLYRYLVGAIGLGALLIGVGGLIQVGLNVLDQELLSLNLQIQLAWSISIVVAGLPVWLIPWLDNQRRGRAPGEEGANERHSLVRRIYLYFYILVATLTMLASMVFIIYGLIGTLLGENLPSIAELGLAIAYTLIAVAVWIYHGREVRRDGRLNQAEQQAHLAQIHVSILDRPGGVFCEPAQAVLQREFPGLDVHTYPITGNDGGPDGLREALAQASLAILPVEAMGPACDLLEPLPTRRLLVPMPINGWSLVGVDTKPETQMRQMVYAVRQALAGNEIKPLRPLSPGAITGIVIGALSFLCLFSSLLTYLISLIGRGY